MQLKRGKPALVATKRVFFCPYFFYTKDGQGHGSLIMGFTSDIIHLDRRGGIEHGSIHKPVHTAVTYTYDDGESDYIHATKKMGSYSGKKMHKKRNLLNQFLNLYDNEVHQLVGKKFDDAYRILEQWNVETNLAIDDSDFFPCKEALDHYEALHICGGIYYAEGEPAGFIIGEEINDKTFAIHFAKATRKFKGIYQFMFNNLANILPEKYEYLNFEQDLGKESLRQAKSTYRPDKMIKKYRVSLK